ncbi:hypothetical protein OS493_003850 [Desmophyllum pertusum]|uniref:Fe2OG dioxygenase domain-containing protein n=1 Tax=Desmophyllum pertusum TaxID=174260 RepID=A0A9X0DBU4_9CNID|nr:hypothetical protein OS493_003850 [Desmophyllum pertusum]
MMAVNISGIPVVDFSAMTLKKNKDSLSENDEAIKDLANQMHQAFSTIGFVYLKNHGIPQEVIDSGFEIYDTFFNLSPEIKQNYSKKEGSSPNGWDELERESTNPERPGDLKESFDVGAVDDENFNWPNAEVPNFQSNVTSIYKYLADLGLKVLSVMAIGLQLEPDSFAYAYEKRGTLLGGTQLRSNYYPMIADISKVKPGQIRCGEHTDYGGIALLIQDDAGGLEVSHINGHFVPARPMKGTVLVNIGDLMQRWTSDKLKSTVHRVLIPEDEIKRRAPRRSLAFFVDPDVSALITCMDGLNKYPPITSGDWMQYRLKDTYKF